MAVDVGPGALGLDFLQHIVDVHWAEDGGIFVFGDMKYEGTPGDIYRGEVSPVEGEDSDWSIVHSDNTSAYAGRSYALVGSETNTDGEPTGGTPTFVMGSWVNGSMSIVTSHNAKTWFSSYTESGVQGGLGVQGIVWDTEEKAFYAAAWTHLKPGNDNETFRGYLLQSSDGLSWSRQKEFISTIGSGNSDEMQEALADALKEHCIKPENEGGFPDGIRAYDPKKKILMKPAGIEKWTIFGPDNSTSGTLIIEGGDNAGSVNLPVTNLCGVAFAGNVWAALGNNRGDLPNDTPTKVFTSIDDGKTWQLAYTSMVGANELDGIIGGAKKDIDALAS